MSKHMDSRAVTYSGTIKEYRLSLQRHMPPGSLRDFHAWAISNDNPAFNKWEQIIGIPQFANLTHRLLDGLVHPNQWNILIEYASRMNAYLIYETVSDNLAIGLATDASIDETAAIRRRILETFDSAMVSALQGDHSQMNQLMQFIQSDANQISNFEQSLTENEQRAVANVYARFYGHNAVTLAEYDTWSPLMANIQSCCDVVHQLHHTQLGAYFRDGLVLRYEAVNRLLADEPISMPDLLDISTHSILVIPVLTYYISVITEIINPDPAIAELYDDGTLHQALYDAALMVRLLNDLGTGLMVSNREHHALFNRLYDLGQDYMDGNHTIGDFLLEVAPSMVILSRIHKDLAFGEFNVSLNALAEMPLSPDTLLLYGTNIIYLQQCYHGCRMRLEKNLSIIDSRLKHTATSQLIRRFVDFHELIYSHRFDSQAGDYATTPDQKLA